MTVSKPSAPVSDHWQSPSWILLMVLKQFIHNRICCLFKISTYILTKTHRTRSDIQFPFWHSPASLVRSESKWAIFGVSFHIFLQHRGWILLFRTGLTGGIPAGQNIVRRGVVDFRNIPSAPCNMFHFLLVKADTNTSVMLDLACTPAMKLWEILIQITAKPLKKIISFTFN